MVEQPQEIGRIRKKNRSDKHEKQLKRNQEVYQR